MKIQFTAGVKLYVTEKFSSIQNFLNTLTKSKPGTIEKMSLEVVDLESGNETDILIGEINPESLKEHEELVEAEKDAVPHQLAEHGRAEELFEVEQPDPRAREDAPGNAVALEGDDDPVHGDAVDDDEVHHHGKNEKIEMPLVPVHEPSSGPLEQVRPRHRG